MPRSKAVPDDAFKDAVEEWPKDGKLPSTANIRDQINEEHGTDYDRKTIYRRLHALESAGKINKIEVGTGRGRSIGWAPTRIELFGSHTPVSAVPVATKRSIGGLFRLPWVGDTRFQWAVDIIGIAAFSALGTLLLTAGAPTPGFQIPLYGWLPFPDVAAYIIGLIAYMVPVIAFAQAFNRESEYWPWLNETVAAGGSWIYRKMKWIQWRW